MSGTPPSQSPGQQPRSQSKESARKRPFGVSSYDRSAGALVAFLIFVGVVLFCVFVIWITNQTFSIAESRPIYLAEPGGGDPEGTDDRGLDLDMPLAEQIAQETDLEEENLEEMLSLLPDVLATRMAELQDPFEADQVSGGQTGGSTGTGDDQAFGEGGGQGYGIAREDRWIILYDQTSLGTYASQLDHFGIEIGVIGRGHLYFVKNMASGSPAVRQGTANTVDNRLRFTWTSGTLQRFDQQLVERAGLDPAGMIIVHFYSPELEQELAHLEHIFQGKEGKEIRRTRFSVQSDGEGGYVYRVVDQELL